MPGRLDASAKLRTSRHPRLAMTVVMSSEKISTRDRGAKWGDAESHSYVFTCFEDSREQPRVNCGVTVHTRCLRSSPNLITVPIPLC